MSMVAVGVGVAAVGTYMNSQAIGNAADQQAQSSQDALNLQRQQYDQTRADNEPFRQAGIGALGELQNQSFMNNWQSDPGYQFRMNEGTKALNNAASARGLNNSGATLKALTRYGQDYSSNEYGKVYDRNVNRLGLLLGQGANANSQNNAASSNYSNNASNTITNLGNSQAAGSIAQGNNITNGISNGINQWQSYQMMNRLFGGGSGGVSYGGTPNMGTGTGYLGNFNFGGTP